MWTALSSYIVKSAIKTVFFLGLPIGYCIAAKDAGLKNLWKFKTNSIVIAVTLGIISYGVIVGGYFLLRPIFDFSNITTALTNDTGVNAANFISVAIYISVVNSLLEEFFFRGFAFLILKQITGRRTSYLISAGAFALYHIAMMTRWFSPALFLLLILGLFAAGLLFDKIDEKNNNLYPSWMIHMFANLAINTIGLMLFGII